MVCSKITERQKEAADNAAPDIVFILPVKTFFCESCSDHIHFTHFSSLVNGIPEANTGRQHLHSNIGNDKKRSEYNDHLQCLGVSHCPGSSAHGIDDQHASHYNIGEINIPAHE